MLGRDDRAEMLACWREDPETSGSGDVDIPTLIDLHAVDRVFARGARHVEEDAAVGERAVRVHVVTHHHFLLLIPVPDVQVLLVRRERQAVRAAQLLADQLELLSRQPKDAAEWQFLARIVGELRQSKRGIGEVQRAVRFVDEIVRAVQSLAFEAIGKDGQRTGLFQTADAVVAMLVDRQASIAVERQAIGAWLSVFADVQARCTRSSS